MRVEPNVARQQMRSLSNAGHRRGERFVPFGRKHVGNATPAPSATPRAVHKHECLGSPCARTAISPKAAAAATAVVPNTARLVGLRCSLMPSPAGHTTADLMLGPVAEAAHIRIAS